MIVPSLRTEKRAADYLLKLRLALQKSKERGDCFAIVNNWISFGCRIEILSEISFSLFYSFIGAIIHMIKKLDQIRTFSTQLSNNLLYLLIVQQMHLHDSDWLSDKRSFTFLDRVKLE